MTPVLQQFRHDPANGVYGDCQRAAIASLLDLPLAEVPNFNEGGPDAYDFYERLDTYLATKNLGRFTIAFQGNTAADVLNAVGTLNPDVYYTLSGMSPRRLNHIVVCKSNKIVHDTHPDAGGFIGPCNDGYYYVEVLVPGILKSD